MPLYIEKSIINGCYFKKKTLQSLNKKRVEGNSNIFCSSFQSKSIYWNLICLLFNNFRVGARLVYSIISLRTWWYRICTRNGWRNCNLKSASSNKKRPIKWFLHIQLKMYACLKGCIFTELDPPFPVKHSAWAEEANIPFHFWNVRFFR